MLLGVEEIISRSGLNAVLNLAKKQPVENSISAAAAQRMNYSDITEINEALEKMYGPRGGRGIALRAGRASFKYILRQHGTAMAVTELNYRMLPVPVRLKTGLEALAGLMGRIGSEQVLISENEQQWIWQSQSCPLCWQRTVSQVVCHFTAGLLQEYFAWASSGRVFGVTEVECRAAGKPACLFVIDKKSFD